MESRFCSECGGFYIPKESGYNAKFCAGVCRNRAKKKRIGPAKLSVQHKRRYSRIKLDPERLARHNLQSKTSHQKVRSWLALYKLERGCIDCGFKKHFAALQLDHTGPKAAEIADCRSSISRLQDEIKRGQCEVRCANCHSIKTYLEKQKKVDLAAIGGL